MELHAYGMRLRPYSIGCQPSGVWRRKDSKQYHDVILYTRPLSKEEMEHYSLDYLGTETEEE